MGIRTNNPYLNSQFSILSSLHECAVVVIAHRAVVKAAFHPADVFARGGVAILDVVFVDCIRAPAAAARPLHGAIRILLAIGDVGEVFFVGGLVFNSNAGVIFAFCNEAFPLACLFACGIGGEGRLAVCGNRAKAGQIDAAIRILLAKFKIIGVCLAELVIRFGSAVKHGCGPYCEDYEDDGDGFHITTCEVIACASYNFIRISK